MLRIFRNMYTCWAADSEPKNEPIPFRISTARNSYLSCDNSAQMCQCPNPSPRSQKRAHRLGRRSTFPRARHPGLAYPPLREQHQNPKIDANNTCRCADKGVALARLGGGGRLSGNRRSAHTHAHGKTPNPKHDIELFCHTRGSQWWPQLDSAAGNRTHNCWCRAAGTSKTPFLGAVLAVHLPLPALWPRIHGVEGDPQALMFNQQAALLCISTEDSPGVGEGDAKICYRPPPQKKFSTPLALLSSLPNSVPP